MAGIIVGIYGYQRSGKSLFANILCELCIKKNMKVYSNVNSPNYIKIDKLTEIPVNNEPKVLLLDEVQYYLDSRTWHSNTKSSIFFNSIGKQNILLILTTIRPDYVEKRLREQHNYTIFANQEKSYFRYEIIDCIKLTKNTFFLKKNDKLYKSVSYDTNSVPDYIEMDWDKNIKIKKGDIKK